MAPSLKEQIQADLNQARRDRDRHATLVLSTLVSEIRNFEIEKGRAAGDEDVREVTTRAIKQRRDAAEQMTSGGRPELAEKELAEVQVLLKYLPPQLSEDEVRAVIREAIAGGADQMGPLMGQVMARVKGRFDGKEVNRLVREELQG